jgi:hypothetical protein
MLFLVYLALLFWGERGGLRWVHVSLPPGQAKSCLPSSPYGLEGGLRSFFFWTGSSL